MATNDRRMLTMQVSDAMHEALRNEADKENRSKANMVETILLEFLVQRGYDRATLRLDGSRRGPMRERPQSEGSKLNRG